MCFIGHGQATPPPPGGASGDLAGGQGFSDNARRGGGLPVSLGIWVFFFFGGGGGHFVFFLFPDGDRYSKQPLASALRLANWLTETVVECFSLP